MEANPVIGVMSTTYLTTAQTEKIRKGTRTQGLSMRKKAKRESAVECAEKRVLCLMRTKLNGHLRAENTKEANRVLMGELSKDSRKGLGKKVNEVSSVIHDALKSLIERGEIKFEDGTYVLTKPYDLPRQHRQKYVNNRPARIGRRAA